MAKRLELSDVPRALIAGHFPTESRGGRWSDHRTMIYRVMRDGFGRRHLGGCPMGIQTKLLRTTLLAGLLVSSAATSDACPVCRSETGEQIRAGIFSEDFGANLLAILLPFAVILGVVAALHLGFTPRRGRIPSGSSAEGH